MPNDMREQGFITIQSSELLLLENELADIGSRAFAYILDMMIRGAVVLGIVLVFSRQTVFLSAMNRVFVPLMLLWWVGYFVLFEILMSGKTPGKKIVGIRAVKVNGERISVLDSCLRTVLRAVDMLPFGYLVAICIMIFERYNRRLGDLVANTIVIYDRSSRKSIRKFLDEMLVESEPRKSVVIRGIERLTDSDKMVIKNFFARRSTMKEGAEKQIIMNKFREKILTKITVDGTDDPEILLCELYKRI